MIVVSDTDMRCAELNVLCYEESSHGMFSVPCVTKALHRIVALDQTVVSKLHSGTSSYSNNVDHHSVALADWD